MKVKNVKIRELEESANPTTVKKAVETIRHDMSHPAKAFSALNESGRNEMNLTTQTFNADIEK
jgi:hypothetical protein